MSGREGNVEDARVSRDHRSERNENKHQRPHTESYRDREPRRITQDELNELSARVLRNKMRGSSDTARLEKRLTEYTDRFNMEEKKKKHPERFKPQFASTTTNEDEMSIEQMLRHEKTTSGMDKSAVHAIMKDKKYSNGLEYQEENSSRLSEYVKRGDIDLRNMETSQAKRQAHALDKCQLCIENDHCCALVSMGESVYLTLAPRPELADFTTMIVPLRHLQNTLHCDASEWDEIKHYMVALSRFYYSKWNKSVVFYETAVNKYKHAAIVCVPIPMSLSSSIKGYFKMAILEESDDFEQRHQPIVDTLLKSEALGQDAFMHSIAKEAPYFHVWFTMNGGMGHIVEDTKSWPHGDLFARQVIGGALKLDPYIIKKQGHWEKNDSRVDEFTQLFIPFDWTEKLQTT